MSYVKSVSGSDYRFLVRGVMLYHTCPWLNLLNGPLMFKRRYVTLLPLFVLLAACSSKPKPTETDTTTGTPSGGFLLEPQHNVMQMGGDFANNPNAQQFIDKMVNKHGFDRQQLQEILSQAKRLDSVLRLMDNQAPTTSVKPPSGPNGAWLRYRKKFITPDNVQNGVVFWNQYEDALNRAWQVYGVPPEIIVGIIGVETRWGRVMGKTRILDALATLSFNYPRRTEYFSGELETFLLMARDEQDDPLNLKGSFAGAMGYGQFMPSSYKQYAVDFAPLALAVGGVRPSDAHAFVDLDAAPFERFQNVILRSGDEPLRIGVLDTQDHRSLVPAGEQVVVQCRTDAADVQRPGGAGREAHPNWSFHSCIL